MEEAKPVEDEPMKDDTVVAESKMQTDEEEPAAVAATTASAAPATAPTAMDVDENSAGAELMDQ